MEFRNYHQEKDIVVEITSAATAKEPSESSKLPSPEQSSDWNHIESNLQPLSSTSLPPPPTPKVVFGDVRDRMRAEAEAEEEPMNPWLLAASYLAKKAGDTLFANKDS